MVRNYKRKPRFNKKRGYAQYVDLRYRKKARVAPSSSSEDDFSPPSPTRLRRRPPSPTSSVESLEPPEPPEPTADVDGDDEDAEEQEGIADDYELPRYTVPLTGPLFGNGSSDDEDVSI